MSRNEGALIRSMPFLQLVETAIRIGARVCIQEGVVHPEAVERARKAGLVVVMDSCILKEHVRRFRMAAN